MFYESRVLLRERMFMKDSQMDVEFIHTIEIARLSVDALRGPGPHTFMLLSQSCECIHYNIYARIQSLLSCRERLLLMFRICAIRHCQLCRTNKLLCAIQNSKWTQHHVTGSAVTTTCSFGKMHCRLRFWLIKTPGNSTNQNSTIPYYSLVITHMPALRIQLQRIVVINLSTT